MTDKLIDEVIALVDCITEAEPIDEKKKCKKKDNPEKEDKDTNDEEDDDQDESDTEIENDEFAKLEEDEEFEDEEIGEVMNLDRLDKEMGVVEGIKLFGNTYAEGGLKPDEGMKKGLDYMATLDEMAYWRGVPKVRKALQNLIAHCEGALPIKGAKEIGKAVVEACKPLYKEMDKEHKASVEAEKEDAQVDVSIESDDPAIATKDTEISDPYGDQVDNKDYTAFHNAKYKALGLEYHD